VHDIGSDDKEREQLVRAAYELLRHRLGVPAEPSAVHRSSPPAPIVSREAVAQWTGVDEAEIASFFQDDASLEHEVLSYALDASRSGGTDVQQAGAFRSGFDLAEGHGVRPSDVMMEGPMRSVDELCTSHLFPLYLHLWCRGRLREDVLARVGDAYRQMHRQWVDMPVPFDERLVRYGRKIRPPFDADSVTTLFIALLEGLALRRVADEDAAPLELAGHAVNALFHVVTAPEHDDRTLGDIMDASDREMMAAAHRRGYLSAAATAAAAAQLLLDPEASPATT
jgi:hypothetical protein